jgi:hypothetical protein
MKTRRGQLLLNAALVAAVLIVYGVVGVLVLVVMNHQPLLGVGLAVMARWGVTVIQRRVLKRKNAPARLLPNLPVRPDRQRERDVPRVQDPV